jgi:adenylate cyclase
MRDADTEVALAPTFNPIRLRSSHEGIGHPVSEPDLVRWLLAEGRHIPGDARLLDALSWRLVGAGVPLWRSTLHIGTLHPQLLGMGSRWRRDTNVAQRFKVLRGVERTDDFIKSPLRRVVIDGIAERYRRNDPAWQTIPLLIDLASEGATDYYAQPVARFSGRHQAMTWATDAPDGFTDEHIALIDCLVPALGALVELRGISRIAELLLETYHGRMVGPRILAGQIERGVGERMRAVILASDLRGFTRLSDRLPGDEVIALLDEFFERIVEPVHQTGGDVLKFVGDGMLAIFPALPGEEESATQAALEAARKAVRRLEEWNVSARSRKAPSMNAGFGLHLGEVIYGNVGSPDRLDFTAIGPAVNLAARLESLTKRLERPILCSRDFAAAYPGPLVSLGFQPVRGFADPEELFGVDD